MKNRNLLLSCLFLSISTSALAQIPQGINYQTVVRDKNNQVLSKQQVALSFEFILGSPNGIIVYSEQHLTTTNLQGVASLVLGRGINTVGKFTDVPWANGDIYLRIFFEKDSIGTIQLMSVPYAMYALKANQIDNPQSTISWLVGSGLPSVAQGQHQDLYLNALSGEFFQKEQSSWVLKGSLKGPEGKQGIQGIPGEQGPAGISTLTGDVTGTATAARVVALQNRTLSSSLPGSGHLLRYIGGSWQPTTLSLALTGTSLSIEGVANSVPVTLPFATNIWNASRLQGSPISPVTPTNTNQYLRWNGTQWEPSTINTSGGSSFSSCGSGSNAPALLNRQLFLGNCSQSSNPPQLEVNTTSTNFVQGMRVNAIGGSSANDGVIIFSKSLLNNASGLKVAAQSGGGGATTGMQISVGGNSSNVFEDISNSQNIGLFINLLDNSSNNSSAHTDRDIGLLIKRQNDDDYAAYFDGDVAIPRELEFIDPNDPGNGKRWALSILKGNRSTISCGSNNVNDFMFEYENNVKAVLDNSSGMLCPTSDIRLKENIIPIPPVLNAIKFLNPVNYVYKSDQEKKFQIGFVAQEVEAIFPELINIVSNNEFDDLRTLNYSGFSVIAIKAIQEQQTIIEAQKTQLATQEERLKNLEEEIAQIKQLLLQNMKGHTIEQAQVGKTENKK